MEGVHDDQSEASLTDTRNLDDIDDGMMTRVGERKVFFSEDSTCSVDNLLLFFLI